MDTEKYYSLMETGGIQLRSPYPTPEELQAVRDRYKKDGLKACIWGGYGVINIYIVD